MRASSTKTSSSGRKIVNWWDNCSKSTQLPFQIQLCLLLIKIGRRPDFHQRLKGQLNTLLPLKISLKWLAKLTKISKIRRKQEKTKDYPNLQKIQECKKNLLMLIFKTLRKNHLSKKGVKETQVKRIKKLKKQDQFKKSNNKIRKDLYKRKIKALKKSNKKSRDNQDEQNRSLLIRGKKLWKW